MYEKVAIIGNGWVGKAYNKMFPDAYIYDEPLGIGTREEVNKCELAIVCVPTPLDEDEELDMSIVEDVISWLDTPLILIKSALMPGTVDNLKKLFPQKRITVSVEMVGEGKYFTPPWKYPDPENPTMHNFLIIGGEPEDCHAVAEFLWNKMSPDIDIHIVSAVEAEICKLMENTWGAMKVTFANTIYDICEHYGANFIRVLQAWGSDGRTGKMHMRVLKGKRGWKSKCWDKDVPALLSVLRNTGCPDHLIWGIIEANKGHLENNK